MEGLYKNYKQFQSSALFLICANLVPVAGVIFLNWDVIDILILYLTESAVIGFYNILKIIATSIKGKTYQQIMYKIWACLFFPIHYTGMLILSGAMIHLISALFFNRPLEPLPVLAKVWPALASLTASHGFSFVRNYLQGGERKRVWIKKLMFQPYSRVGVMLLTVVLGVLVIIWSGQRFYLIIVLVFIKTIIDLIAHLRERIKSSRE